MKKVKDAETQRFIFEIDALIEARPDLNRSKITLAIGRSPQDFTDIYGGKKKLQRYFLDAVAKSFPIDKHFILTGDRKHSEYTTNENLLVAQEPQEKFNTTENDLRYTIKIQEECLGSHRARIKMLEAENIRLAERLSKIEGRHGHQA